MMKQLGNCITGDPIRVDSFTSDWMSVKLHPSTYYRRQEDFLDSLQKLTGLYAKIDMRQYVIIKFSNKDDLTSFHRYHHEYI